MSNDCRTLNHPDTARARRRLALCSAALTAALLQAGGAGAAEIKSVALITPEQPTDFGWNQQGIEGAKAAATAHKLEFQPAAGVGYGDVKSIIRDLVSDGAGLIIAHGPYASQAAEISADSKIYAAVTDFPGKPPYVADYSLGGQQGAYLAGRLAAKMTKTGSLGIVVSSESSEWNSQTAGFIQGAREEKPGVAVHYAVIGPEAYSDVAGAKRVTESMLASGPDIIFGQGDGATFGMIQAVENAKPPGGGTIWFIDVIGNKTSLDKGHLLSSVVWNFTPVFSEMIDDIHADKFGTHGYKLQLTDDSIGLLKTKHIPDDVWAAMMKLRDDVISGKIKVGEVFDAGQIHKLVASAAK